MPSKWIEHIKDYAKSNGMSYKDALKDPKCKSAYSSGKGLGGAMEAPKDNVEMKITEVMTKRRGRPPKYFTEEDRKQAKSMKTMESNKRKKIDKGEGIKEIRELKKKTDLKQGLSSHLQNRLNPDEIDDLLQSHSTIYSQYKEKTTAELKRMRKAEFKKGNYDTTKSPLLEINEVLDERGEFDNEGKGLNVGYITENANGLGHIYPISHDMVLQMLSCCPK